jgi:hypothetical protein
MCYLPISQQAKNKRKVKQSVTEATLISGAEGACLKSQHMREIWFYVMSGGVMLKIVVVEIARIIHIF